MATLFPPLYPERPDAPLLAFGPSFSEEIARSVIQTIFRGDQDEPHEHEIRIAAGLTMLEAFHPRDHLECMLAAQGVGFHCAIMETLARAMLPEQPEPVAIKLRANASQMSRTFSNLLRDMERRQTKPLPERPGQAPPTPGSGGPGDGNSPSGPGPGDPGLDVTVADDPGGAKPRTKRAPAKGLAAKAAIPARFEPAASFPPNRDDGPELPEDIETRPDGTPGSLAGYIPKPAVVEFVPREPAIMIALATRPKPWRMVNAPAGEAAAEPAPSPETQTAGEENSVSRGPLDPRERIFSGDSLSRFASARFDPDAPIEKLVFEDEDSVVELELVSTGGDPAAEAERQAMIAAHPEGKPIAIFRHGTQAPPEDPPDPEGDENPPET
jgi:hypothetical protein